MPTYSIPKMTNIVTVRVDDSLKERLNDFTEKTGTTTAQVARWGIEAQLAEFEDKGHITPTVPPQTQEKP